MALKIKLNYVEKTNVYFTDNAMFFNGIWLALCKEIIAVYSTKLLKHIDTLFGKTQSVCQSCGTYCSRCDLNS